MATITVATNTRNLKFLFLIFGLMLLSCKEGASPSPIVIDMGDSEPLNNSELKVDIDVKLLSLNDDSIHIGNITDIAFTKTDCYILDENASISKISINNANSQIKQINSRGHGMGEYILPTAIDVYNDTLFVLDQAMSAIIKYDNDMKPITKFTLNQPSRNFLVHSDQIFLENINLVSNPHLIISVDQSGENKSEYIEVPTVKDFDNYVQGSLFIENLNDNIYALDGKNNTVYKYDNLIFSPICHFDFGKYSISKETILDSSNFSQYTLSTHCFVIDNKFILSYLFKTKRLYCIYDTNTGEIQNGSLRMTSDGYPFYPRWQFENKLVGYMESENDKGNGYLLFYTITPQK